MNLFSKTLSKVIILLSATLFFATGCQEYMPPPEAELVRSGTGAYAVGDSLGVGFTSAIDPDSLQINLWPASRGTRRVPESDVEPIVGPCSVGGGCEGITVSIDEDRMGASLEIDDTLAGPGATFVLEVLPGLTDDAGHSTGASYFFTVRYRVTAGDPNANIEFDNGIYVLGGSVNQPMRAVLTLVTHIKVLPDGRLSLVGAKGNPDEEASDTTRDPEEITIDDGEWGWTIFATGLVVEDSDGNRFLETEVFDVDIPVLDGSLFLEMRDVRLFADITKDSNGNDFFDGTLTYESLTIINMSSGGSSTHGGDSSELLGDFVPPNLVPAGTPDMCGEICGAVQSLCDPDPAFPHPDFCEE